MRAPSKCDWPRCTEKAEYWEEVQDCYDETIEVDFCLKHHNALLLYNDDKDLYDWNKMTAKQKHQVSSLVYRLTHVKTTDTMRSKS